MKVISTPGLKIIITWVLSFLAMRSTLQTLCSCWLGFYCIANSCVLCNNKSCLCTNLNTRAGCDTLFVFKQNLSLNSEFSLSQTGCHRNYKEPSLIYYLPIALFMSFSRVLALGKTWTALLKFWTWVAMSISYEGHHYTTNAITNSHSLSLSLSLSIYIYIYLKGNLFLNEFLELIFVHG